MTAKNQQDAVRELAYQLWVGRGRPWGSSLQDWLEAERQLATPEPRASIPTPQPPIKVPNPPESEVDAVIHETPKVGSRDAPGG